MRSEASPDRVDRLAATIRGRVQGVGFRWFVLREAADHGLVGWVANAPDGTVRLEAEGRPAALARFVEGLRDGPPGAVVESVTTSSLQPLGSEPRFALRALGHRGD